MIQVLPTQIEAVIADYPPAAKAVFRQIRTIIFENASRSANIGPITETLKWGEPAYLTEATKSGSTLRLAWKPKTPNKIGLYLNCRTTLIATLRDIYPDTFQYQGTRAALVSIDAPLPTSAIEHCIHLAQTYHQKR